MIIKIHIDNWKKPLKKTTKNEQAKISSIA